MVPDEPSGYADHGFTESLARRDRGFLDAFGQRRLEFQVGDERFTLHKGDSIYFDSSVPHRGRSLGVEATALVVIHDSAKR